MLQVPLAPEIWSRVEPVPPVPRRASLVKPGPYLQTTDSPRWDWDEGGFYQGVRGFTGCWRTHSGTLHSQAPSHREWFPRGLGCQWRRCPSSSPSTTVPPPPAVQSHTGAPAGPEPGWMSTGPQGSSFPASIPQRARCLGRGAGGSGANGQGHTRNGRVTKG